MELFDLLQRAGTTPDPDVAVHAAVRQQLTVEAQRATPHRARLGVRRLIAPVAGIAFLVGAGAAAWAVTRSDPQTNTTIECGPNSYIPVETGNPLEDCHDALARGGAQVPPLDAWITSTGLIAVLPEGDQPPPRSTPLPVDFTVDRSVLYVNDVLGDEAQPIATTCTTQANAVAFARVQLRLADLVGWNVEVQSPSNSSMGCSGYSGFLDTSTQTAYLVPTTITGGPSTGEDAKLDSLLRHQLEGTPTVCDSSSQATSLVRTDEQRLGIPPTEVSINDAGAIGAPGPRCAIVTIDPGGSVQATIWQVPATS